MSLQASGVLHLSKKLIRIQFTQFSPWAGLLSGDTRTFQSHPEVPRTPGGARDWFERNLEPAAKRKSSGPGAFSSYSRALGRAFLLEGALQYNNGVRFNASKNFRKVSSFFQRSRSIVPLRFDFFEQSIPSPNVSSCSLRRTRAFV